MATSHDSHRSTLRTLHESGTFVMPNPWDRGTARALELMGFPSLATTSAGHAFGLARPDSPMALRREEVLSHVREIVAATDLPVNADFQTGYEIKRFGVDDERKSVCGYGVFRATHTGEGGPLPPTGKSVEADYVCCMQFEGDRIRHMTKIWNDGHSFRQIGWA